MRRTHRRTAKLLRRSLFFVFAVLIVSNFSDCIFASSGLRSLITSAFHNSNTKRFGGLGLIRFDTFSPVVPQSGTSKIVFASNREGSMQIYVMNGDGTGVSRLTNSGANDDCPRWSPNGSKILFQSDRDHSDTGYMDIYVMNSDGSGVTRLTTDANDDNSASWSADGTKIVFQSFRNGDNYQVYSMAADGSNQVNLSNNSSSDGMPAYSPDGTKVIFASDRDHAGLDSIYVMNADGSNQQALTSPGNSTEDTQPAWSPDGSKIAFVSTRDSTTETWQETDDDGNVLNRSRLHINKEIYVMNADGSGQTRLTNDPANDDSPSWSSLGLNILFRSDRDRDCCDPTPQIWLMNTDGSGLINLSSNNSGDASGSGTMIDFSDNAAKDGSSISADASASLVIINFDSLPTNVAVTNQYPQAIFSSYVGGTVSTASDCSFLGSCPNGIIATSGFGSTYWPNADVYVNFAVPVNGLTFRVLGGRGGGAAGYVDIYANNSYYGTTSFFTGIGFPGQVLPPVIINLSAVQHLTAIRIRNVDNCGDLDCIVRWPLYYDDFAFTPELGVTLTSSRTTGNIDGMTKNALLGADVSLTASGSTSGGTYSWTYSGPVAGGQQSGATTTIHSTDTSDHGGPITAKVTYKLNGVPVTATLTINSILPTVTSFTATQNLAPAVWAPFSCVDPNAPPHPTSLWWFSKGCSAQRSTVGINFLAKVDVPSFISDPSKSGLKYVQVYSMFHKVMSRGIRCETSRTSESDVASGWRVDTEDPYDGGMDFAGMLTITGIDTNDSPDRALTHFDDWEFVDALSVDDRAEMYLLYYSGTNPANPPIQRPLGKYSWNWGGLVVFDWNGVDAVHNLRSTNPVLTSPPSTFPFPPLLSKSEAPCPDGTPFTDNRIDSSREFVKYHYIDFLSRDPNGEKDDQGNWIPGKEPDPTGWNFWTSNISQCVFDLNCVHSKRISTGLAFFKSAEFMVDDPIMANGPGTPNFDRESYNREFVYWCYIAYLHKLPDQQGWDYWTDVLNHGTDSDNYAHMIDAFQVSDDYRLHRAFK